MIVVDAKLTDRGGREVIVALKTGMQGMNIRVAIGTPLKYGYGINWGKHRSGRLARRAGPSLYLSGSFQEELPAVKQDVTATIQRDPADLPNVLLRAGFRIQRKAQERVPKVTRALQRSIVTRKM